LNCHNLEQKLDKIITDFSEEVRLNYSEDSKELATGRDISELARQTFYAMNGFKDEIIKFLKSM